MSNRSTAALRKLEGKFPIQVVESRPSQTDVTPVAMFTNPAERAKVRQILVETEWEMVGNLWDTPQGLLRTYDAYELMLEMRPQLDAPLLTIMSQRYVR